MESLKNLPVDKSRIPTGNLLVPNRVLFSLGASIFPFFFLLPPWIPGVSISIVFWQLFVGQKRKQVPRVWLRVILLGFAIVVVIATFHEFGGARAGGAFLLLTASLKTLESHRERDFRLLLILTVFLVGTGFLLSQSLPMMLYGVIVIWATLFAGMGRSAFTISLRSLAARSLKFLMISCPLAAILFLVFPRLPAPLFRLSPHQSAGLSGLSPVMTPTDLSRLALSQKLAFQVHFSSVVPPPSKRYFVGPVLTRYNGKTWSPTKDPVARSPDFKYSGAPIRYRVIEQANGEPWLFLLALPAQISTDAHINGNFVVTVHHPLWKAKSFHGVSYTNYVLDPQLSSVVKQRNLQLPSQIDPRAKQLAEHWKSMSTSKLQIVRKALRYFYQKPFYYTLDPPPIKGRNRMDQFLFKTRKGFCEYYASAFAVLMRYAGIPTRVVTGYAGGTINPINGWLIVREANAHAWDQVWISGKGWIRVDPTASISPQRVEPSALFSTETGTNTFDLSTPSGIAADVSYFWEAADDFWSENVVGYNEKSQRHLLSQIQSLNKNDIFFILTLFLAAIAGTGFAIISIKFKKRPKKSQDTSKRLYDRWRRKLTKNGMEVRRSEGPLDLLMRIEVERPELFEESRVITRLYISARYEEKSLSLAPLKRQLTRTRKLRKLLPGKRKSPKTK